MKDLPGQFFSRGLRAVSLACFSVALLAAAPTIRAAEPQNQVTKNFEKTVTLTGSQGVSLEHKLGKVTVVGVSGSEVKISATIRVQTGSQSDSQAFADKIQIEVRQEGDGVHIKTIYPDDIKNWISFGKRSYSVDYNITMPSEAPLWLRNSFGNVEVAGQRGWSQVENNNGSLLMRDVGTARITNSFGSVDLNTAYGNCAVTNGNGAVHITGIKGTLEARTRFGEIVISQVTGGATVSGGNGRIEVSNVNSNTTIANSFGETIARNITGGLTITSNNGRISATDISGNTSITGSFGEVVAERIGGTLNVEDNNGQVKVREVKGALNARTSFGGVDASNLYAGASITTGNGNVTVGDLAGDLFVKNSFGSVHTQNTKGSLTVQNSNGAIVANSVGGDATITTSFGGVQIGNVAGKVQVTNQNGAIDVGAMPSSGCKDVSLKTSFSSMRVRVSPNVGYNVSAVTSFGHISSEVPLTSSGTIGNSMLNGTIGNGGCALNLVNSNGNIEIVK